MLRQYRAARRAIGAGTVREYRAARRVIGSGMVRLNRPARRGRGDPGSGEGGDVADVDRVDLVAA
eukprot:1099348-Rhodomonas_salina.2